MLKHLAAPPKSRLADCHVRSAFGPKAFSASIANSSEARRVDHRDGSGHLDPIYEAALRVRVQDRARETGERAFVSAASRAEPGADESGEKFVTTVTCGEDGEDAPPRDETSEERGGPFVKTRASVEFAYDTDGSNPIDATREPFPTS